MRHRPDDEPEPRAVKIISLTFFPPGRPPIEIPGERVLVHDPHAMAVQIMAAGEAVDLYVGIPYKVTVEPLAVQPARGPLIVPPRVA